MKKGIIFDMDGTLWDSSESVAAAWDIAVRSCGYERPTITAEDLQRVMGKTMDVIAGLLFPNAKGKEAEAILEACCREEDRYLREHGGVLYPQLVETMKKLQENYHLYIVSNCQCGYIETFLDYYQLWALFEDRQCYGDNGLGKADNIRILADRNQLDAAVYVGDIQGDYDASCAAGVGFIHAAYGFGTINTEVPAIHSLAELAEVAPRVL